MHTTQYTRPCPMIVLWPTLLGLAALSIALSIAFGSVHISFANIMQSLTAKNSINHTILFQIRLPRTACAFITGGFLALAGALMQTLLRNPLADPYVLGVSGGAAVMSLMAMLLGFSLAYLSLWAFVGSIFSIVLVMGIARHREHLAPLRLLLTGVVVATGWAAIISLILIVSPEHNLRGMLFWLMGDLSYAHFEIWQPMVLVAGLAISLFLAKPLNVLTCGDLSAQSFGVHTKKLNFILYLIGSLLTACAVSIAGCIGFVGLIIPHMLRMITGSDHRIILPASVLLGGTLLTLADTLARTLVAPVQLPVGIVTAIIGVPSFLLLLQRGYRKS